MPVYFGTHLGVFSGAHRGIKTDGFQMASFPSFKKLVCDGPREPEDRKSLTKGSPKVTQKYVSGKVSK